MFCTECGKEISDGAKFCQHCGSLQNSTDSNKINSQPTESVAEESNQPPVAKATQNKNILIVVVGIIFLAIFVNLVSTNTSPQHTSNQPTNAPTESNPLIGGGLDVNLKSVANENNNFCNLFFEVKNNTKMNITGGMISTIKKDDTATIVDKGYIHLTSGIKPGATSTLEMYSDKCASIASIDLIAIETLRVDGEFLRGINDSDIPLFAGSESDIVVNSTAGRIKESNLATPSDVSKKSSFEAAIDPYTGSKSLWDKFVDNGGLNSDSNYYGIPVREVNIQWHEEKIKLVLMIVSKSVAPAMIRRALSKGCGVAESNWQTETGNLIRGVAKKGNLECSYLTNDAARNYDVSIQLNSD